MSHLALNVYVWTPGEQTHVLTTCLGPQLRALRTRGVVRHLSFGRFDARGPHLFLALALQDDADSVRRELSEALNAHFAEFPATRALDQADLQRRHDQCRGKQLCTLDGAPGFGEPGTFLFAEHPSSGYPFGIVEHPTQAIWNSISDAALWAIEHLESGSQTGAAVRWVADVSVALERSSADAEPFWRYHATTLLLSLSARLEADEAAVLSALPASVGERNQQAFARVWDTAERDGPLSVSAEEIVTALCQGQDSSKAIVALREINHGVLQQLAQPVSAHVPLVLFAWARAVAANERRTAAREEPAPASLTATP